MVNCRAAAAIFAGMAVAGMHGTASAHTHIYEAELTGAGEAIPNSSTATGLATITLDLDLITMQVDVSFAGLGGTSLAPYIRGATAVPFTGTAGPMNPALSASGFPLGVTSGSYSYTFDLTDSPGYDPGFVTLSGGTISDALNALIFAFEDGTAYLSIPSTAFPSGEIRGFFVEVPEPGVFTLGLLGAGILAGRRRRVGR